MSLQPGTRLGSFEIRGLLGAGGMGEVYRARDTGLQRDVAIKMLPDPFASDPQRLARFQREARTLATLNHPNIAQVHGLVDVPGRHGLGVVMELVEGEDLARRLTRGAVPMDEALGIARQICEGLEAAHERGIIHRDLKPANIIVRADGTVKLLDFGLAKLEAPEPAGSGGDGTDSPTITSPATHSGVILGTAAYMAPEQAKGRIVDKRADIWAFGCVLYEMITGGRPFAGDGVSETLANILTKDPDWRPLPSDTPFAVRALLRRCLQKQTRDRLRDAGDARLQLNDASADSPDAVGAVSVRRGPEWMLFLLAGLVAMVTFLGWRLTRPVPGGTNQVVRFSVLPPGGAEFMQPFPAAAISRDGQKLVTVVERNGQTHLEVRGIDSFVMTPIAGTDGANRPFFSYDGKWIAFTLGLKLMRVPHDGGTPLEICQSEWGAGVWLADDTIIFTPHYSSGLWRVAARGGTPEKLTEPDRARGDVGHFWPQVLPDGRHLLYTRFNAPRDRSRVAVYSLDTREDKVVVEGGMHGWYSPTGHLLYAGITSIVAAPFDTERRVVTGAAFPILDDVDENVSNGFAQFAVSPAGTMTFMRYSDVAIGSEMVWVDRKGTFQPAVPGLRVIYDFRVSPDGQRVAATLTEGGNRDIWVYDFSRSVMTRVTTGAAGEFGPVWSHDGRRLAFVSERPLYSVFQKAADGAGAEEPLFAGQYDAVPSSFSPDGTQLVFAQNPKETLLDLWVLSLKDGSARPLVKTAAIEAAAVVSPDGHWLAYHSNDSGQLEVYVRQFPEGEERWQVSNGRGASPRWRRDGRELVYLSGGRIMSVAVSSNGRQFSAGRPTTVLTGPFLGFDVAPDGQRFLVLRADPDRKPAPLNVVLNWFTDLKARVASSASAR